MSQMTTDKTFTVAFFSTVAEADRAVRGLLNAGFSKEELAVICPERCKSEFTWDVPRAERPGSHAAAAVVEGGAVGAAIGGIALAVTAVATGGVGLIPAIPVLIGGGALAGGFTSLIIQDGYGKEIGQYYEELLRLDRIVIGVATQSEDAPRKLAQAERIMEEAGGVPPSALQEEPVSSAF